MKYKVISSKELPDGMYRYVPYLSRVAANDELASPKRIEHLMDGWVGTNRSRSREETLTLNRWCIVEYSEPNENGYGEVAP